MKQLSVRKKLTLWITILMSSMVCIVIAFLFGMSNRVALQSAQEQLSAFVRSNFSLISKENGQLQFSKHVQFSRNGMYLLVYNESGAQLAGQTPLSFPASVPFENGLTRPVIDREQDDTYLVLDFWLPFSWEDGVWIRGIMQAPELQVAMHRLFDLSLLLLPLFVLVGASGTYWIVRRAFRPIDQIVGAASEISEGRDLSRRIGIPTGKDEISQLAATFDQMFERLESAFESESQFTSDASHELRTPTAVILAQCQEAEQHAQTLEEYAAAIGVIHRQADRISNLTTQLLQMTRLEQGTVPICMEEADLGALIEVLCEEQKTVYPDREITMQVPDDLNAWFDVTLMTRMLQNLLENACRYGGQKIQMKAMRNQEQIVIWVSDNGSGIPKNQQDKIWKRFYRIESARSAGQGTGLGLPMVAQIVQLHQGTISLHSSPESGTTFTIRLPYRPQEN